MEVRPGYKQTDVGVIPKEWECGKLEEYFSFISYGFTNPMPTVEHGVFMVTAADINDGRLQLETARKTTEQAYRTLLTAKSKPRKDDILLTKDGSLGRLALVHDEQICINQSVAVIRPNEKVEPIFLKMLLESPAYQRKMLGDAGGSTIKHIYITIVNLMLVTIPSRREEQKAIASAINDIDQLLAGLERLIAKKRILKQAAMQQLLTGKTRIPGFVGAWVVRRLGDMLTICHGRNQSAVEDAGGLYPILATGGQIGTASRALYDKPSVLIGRKGTINQPQYMDTPFWTVDTLFYSEIKGNNNAKFLYYCFCLIDWMQYNEASGVPSLNAKTIENVAIAAPLPAEQSAIAAILSDMDAELATLEARREKTRALKQAMTQELLTGNTRLV